MLSKPEQSKHYRNIKNKYETIIVGLFEDQIDILVNNDTRHLIESSLV